jgi:hypothetical protein
MAADGTTSQPVARTGPALFVLLSQTQGWGIHGNRAIPQSGIGWISTRVCAKGGAVHRPSLPKVGKPGALVPGITVNLTTWTMFSLTFFSRI